MKEDLSSKNIFIEARVNLTEYMIIKRKNATVKNQKNF